MVTHISLFFNKTYSFHSELNNVDFELENIVIESGQLYITNPDFTVFHTHLRIKPV